MDLCSQKGELQFLEGDVGFIWVKSLGEVVVVRTLLRKIYIKLGYSGVSFDSGKAVIEELLNDWESLNSSQLLGNLETFLHDLPVVNVKTLQRISRDLELRKKFMSELESELKVVLYGKTTGIPVGWYARYMGYDE